MTRRIASVLTLTLALGLAAVSQAQTLQVHLEFEEDVNDSSPFTRDGELFSGALGSSEYVDGPSEDAGRALDLNHDAATLTSDSVEGAYVAIPYRLPPEGTIALWYRADPFYNFQSIWDTSGEANDWEMWIYNDGRVRGRVNGNVGQVTHQVESSLVWFHIAYTWERGREARLWIDGVERDVDSPIRALSEADFDSAILGDTFYLGGGNPGNVFGVGVFDDFRIYDAALTEEDILDVIAEVAPPPAPDPVLQVHLQLDGDVLDSSGFDRHGSLAVGPSGSSAFETGPVGDGLDLGHLPETLTTDTTDGAYVSIPYRLTDAGTIALWYRADPYYNFQSVWDTSGEANDWEMWIYDDGRVRGRIDAGIAQVTHQFGAAEAWHHIVYTWRKGELARLWIDAIERDTGSDARLLSDEAFDAALLGDTFYLGGGNDGNTFGTGVFDDLRIYDGTLDSEAIQALFDAGDPPDPGVEPKLQVWLELNGDVDDSSGFDRHGEIVEGFSGSFSFEEAPVGDGLNLDHVPETLTSDMTDGNYVRVPYRLTSSGSILLWYRADPFYNFQTIYDTSGDANDWEMWINSDGRVRGRVDGNVGQVTSQLPAAQRWYHIAYTWEVGGMARLWIDGVEQDTDSDIRAIGGPALEGAIVGDTFFLGGGNDRNVYGVGVFDDLRIYDGALSEAAILEVVGEGDPPVDEIEPENPGESFVYLPMDGDVLNEGWGGADFDGTIFEGAAGTAMFVEGRAGQGLRLENVDPGANSVDGAYVSLPNPLSEEGAISLWYFVENYYNFQSVWDNSVQADDWEMWVYNDGRLRGRIEQAGGTTSGLVTTNLDSFGGPRNWYHIAYAWDRNEASTEAAILYINGNAVDSDAILLWIEPGLEFFLGGGNDGNTYGNGIWDEVRIYDHKLTAGEVLYLFQGGSTCPEEGDTHCRDLLVDGPEGGGPGTYTAITFADDDSGDEIRYLFRADNGVGAPLEVGPQANNVANFELAPGTWTISVFTDDSATCDDEADDAACSSEVVVAESAGSLFHRGDADDSGTLDLTDGVRILGWLFQGGVQPPCLDAADVDDNGRIEVSDPIRLLGYLFLGQPAPEDPGPPGQPCGPDGDGALGCEAYTSCAAE